MSAGEITGLIWSTGWLVFCPYFARMAWDSMNYRDSRHLDRERLICLCIGALVSLGWWVYFPGVGLIKALRRLMPDA